jgi:hypothetical protein
MPRLVDFEQVLGGTLLWLRLMGLDVAVGCQPCECLFTKDFEFFCRCGACEAQTMRRPSFGSLYLVCWRLHCLS